MIPNRSAPVLLRLLGRWRRYAATAYLLLGSLLICFWSAAIFLTVPSKALTGPTVVFLSGIVILMALCVLGCVTAILAIEAQLATYTALWLDRLAADAKETNNDEPA